MKSIITVFLFISMNIISQNINTIAGNGTAGFTGDGGPATSAQLYDPKGICVDASGNVYIADFFGQKVRKINAVTGVITTIAGTGTAGFSGDGGLATSAKLANPISVCMDALGNLYISDGANNRIRKVNTSGIISTFAGTGVAGFSGDGSSATTAQINGAMGLFYSSNGYILFADRYNHRIRKILLSTGVISTVAGIGTAGSSGDFGSPLSAQLNNPIGVCEDQSGYLYIADSGNNKIRNTDLLNRILTFSGTGATTSTGDGGSANLATFSGPNSISIDANENIYLIDNTNNTVRKIDKVTSLITRYAGNGTAGYSGDGGLATNAQLWQPFGVFSDKVSNIYVSEIGNDVVRKVNGPSSTASFTSTAIVCIGSTISFTNTSINAISYSWNFGDGGTSTNINPSHIYNLTGTYTVQLIAQNPNGNDTIEKYIEVYPLTPTITANGSTNLCQGKNLILNSNFSSGNAWYRNGTFLSSTQSCTVSTAGNYVVQVTNLCGTHLSNTLTISIIPSPTISVNSGSICSGKSFTIIPSGASTYTYSSGSSIVSPTTNSSYSVSGTGANGCVSNVNAISNVIVNSNPTVTAISTNSLICIGESTTLYASGANTYTWTNGVTNNIAFSPSVTATYTVTGADLNGCINSDIIQVQVNTCTSLFESLYNPSLVIYPNPTSGQLNISGIDINQKQVTITNVVGDNVRMVETNGNKVVSVDVKNLSPGVYFINSNNKSIKFIKE